MSIRTAMVLAVCLFPVMACASASSREGGLDANIITREQIQDLTGVSNAYTVIEDLRPIWLRKRGSTSFLQEGQIRVYQDGVSLGGVENLRNIHPDNIEYIEFLDARQANFRYGSGHEHGAIMVNTRR